MVIVAPPPLTRPAYVALVWSAGADVAAAVGVVAAAIGVAGALGFAAFDVALMLSPSRTIAVARPASRVTRGGLSFLPAMGGPEAVSGWGRRVARSRVGSCGCGGAAGGSAGMPPSPAAAVWRRAATV